MMQIVKDIFGWLLVAVLFTVIVGMVGTGGAILDPDFWHIVFSK